MLRLKLFKVTNIDMYLYFCDHNRQILATTFPKVVDISQNHRLVLTLIFFKTSLNNNNNNKIILIWNYFDNTTDIYIISCVYKSMVLTNISRS